MRKTERMVGAINALGLAKRVTLVLSSLLVLGLVAVPAWADTLRISCTGSTTCSGGSVTQLTTATTVTFNVTQTDSASVSGEAFIAVLIPNGTASLTESPGSLVKTVTGSTSDFGTALGLTGVSDKNFSTLQSFSAQAGVTATSFSYYEYDLGSFTGTPATLISGVSVGVLPKGSIVIAFTTSGSSSSAVLNITPNSEALTTSNSLTPVPEPNSLLLLGLGLLALGFVARRRLLFSDGPDGDLAA